MALVPRVSKPCPLSPADLPAAGDFHCRHCDRDVHDLTALDDEARRAFVAGRAGPVCVRVRTPVRMAAIACGALVSATSAVTVPLSAEAADEIEVVNATFPWTTRVTIGEVHPTLSGWIDIEAPDLELLPIPKLVPPPSRRPEDDPPSGDD